MNPGFAGGMAGQRQAVCAVVLTLNEESNLERCFGSLRWCDDLVLVDSGSTDTTVALAARLGARVFSHAAPLPFRFSEQRSWALEHCGITAPWVLFVDADEVITPQLADEIAGACRADVDVDGYQLTPKYLFWGRWMRRSTGYPNWHDRLVRVGSTTIEGGLWEHFAPGARVGRIEEPYLHFGNSKGMAEWIERHNGYSDWDASTIGEYLSTREGSAFVTTRKVWQRRVAARVWPLRPVARFLVMYVLRGGFLDGPPALAFCARYAMYEYMIVEKIVERRRAASGEPL